MFRRLSKSICLPFFTRERPVLTKSLLVSYVGTLDLIQSGAVFYDETLRLLNFSYGVKCHHTS